MKTSVIFLLRKNRLRRPGILPKLLKSDSIIKCKEEFINGELWNVVFYQEGETIEEIFGQYPSLNGIDVVTRKEIQGII
jgi:hypothetical protein